MIPLVGPANEPTALGRRADAGVAGSREFAAENGTRENYGDPGIA